MPQTPEERRKAQREYQREWRRKNPDRVRQYAEREKSEERKEYRRRYYQRNREKILKRTAERYRRDPELREVKKARARQWAEKNPELMRERRRRSWAKLRYGLTLDELDAILAAGCALCGATEQLMVDHCHTSGKVRAALCRTCNTGLGQFGDDPARLRAAADYLEKHA